MTQLEFDLPPSTPKTTIKDYLKCLEYETKSSDQTKNLVGYAKCQSFLLKGIMDSVNQLK